MYEGSSTSSVPSRASAAAEGDLPSDHKYLTFLVAGVTYALQIGFVVEIIGMQRITPLPGAPTHIRGVINLRGAVIPVMDLHLRFGLEAPSYTDRTCIIVVDVNEHRVGVIVDTVSEVADLPESAIEPPPGATEGPGGGFVQHIGKAGSNVVIILDVRKVLGVLPRLLGARGQ